jgi:hypothetical protein
LQLAASAAVLPRIGPEEKQNDLIGADDVSHPEIRIELVHPLGA